MAAPSRSFAFEHVDVFTERIFEGNPLAVFTEPGDLSEREMQAIALELNLAETVFVLPPVSRGSLARLRIFTPRRELPFAGHPTVGTVAALVAQRPRIADAFTLDEGVGPVPIRIERRGDALPLIWLTTPRVEFGAAIGADEAAAILGLDARDVLDAMPPCYASAGSPFLFVALRDRGAVDRAAFAAGTLPAQSQPDVIGVFLFTPAHERPEAPHAVYARMFAPWSGILEDPATGGATGPLAACLLRAGMLPVGEDVRLVSEQGTRMGRRSILHVRVTRHDGEPVIEVGGSAVPALRGTLTIPDARDAAADR